ncbi:MAG: hypothetical protein JNN16_11025 [Nitrospira sp.]|nr:hypothetical protein [Nitrospira sp.]
MIKPAVGVAPVHLWIYNHPFCTISDQISFFVMALQQKGYSVSVGREPRHASLNVIIEGFSLRNNRDVLMEFCQSSRKRVAVIMTEHMDFERGRMLFHGAPLGTENDYMHSGTILARTRNLLECLPYLRCFFVLGDLPELRNISTMLPGLDVRTIPFPTIDGDLCRENTSSSDAVHDLVFTGAMTDYRTKWLGLLEASGLSVICPKKFISKNRRNAINRSGKVIVNIPQRQGWNWLSLMRIVAGLQTGRATISLGTHDSSQISSCCTQLDIREHDWVGKVKECVGDWKSLHIRDLMSYSIMAKKFEEARPFPHDVFEYWSVTDRVCY